MRKIITTTFTTMDGVMQAPGGPEEDKSTGFAYGGWMAHYMDDVTGKIIDGFMDMDFELLLGRRTYDIFASYWPHANNDINVAKKFNSVRKYVVSHKKLDLAWKNSTLVTGDVVAELKKLKAMNGPDLWVHGSGELIQTLLKADLIDKMYIWTIPVTIGSGKRLFAAGTKPQGFKLLEHKVSPVGVIVAMYEPAGELVTGTIGE